MANPAKPVELKRALGNPGQGKLPKPGELPVVSGGYVEPLRELSAAGVQLWEETFRYAPWIARTDAPLLQLTCEQVDRREQMREMMVGLGPDDWHMFKQLNDLETAIVSNFGKLGFSPDSRSRLGLAEVKAQSKLEELLARKADRG
jgi:hypothetical protein